MPMNVIGRDVLGAMDSTHDQLQLTSSAAVTPNLKSFVGLSALAIALVSAMSARAQLSEALAAQLSQNADQHVHGQITRRA